MNRPSIESRILAALTFKSSNLADLAKQIGEGCQETLKKLQSLAEQKIVMCTREGGFITWDLVDAVDDGAVPDMPEIPDAPTVSEPVIPSDPTLEPRKSLRTLIHEALVQHPGAHTEAALSDLIGAERIGSPSSLSGTISAMVKAGFLEAVGDKRPRQYQLKLSAAGERRIAAERAALTSVAAMDPAKPGSERTVVVVGRARPNKYMGLPIVVRPFVFVPELRVTVMNQTDVLIETVNPKSGEGDGVLIPFADVGNLIEALRTAVGA